MKLIDYDPNECVPDFNEYDIKQILAIWVSSSSTFVNYMKWYPERNMYKFRGSDILTKYISDPDWRFSDPTTWNDECNKSPTLMGLICRDHDHRMNHSNNWNKVLYMIIENEDHINKAMSMYHIPKNSQLGSELLASIQPSSMNMPL